MKILYGVQGTGNGHIARSRAMALAFAKVGAKVDFLFSGREPESYFSMEAFGDYQTRRGLTFISHHGKIDPFQTAWQARPLQFLREIRELDLTGYDLVINDFEPVSAWAARQQQVPCIGISHQNSFRYPIPAAERGVLDRLLVRHFAPCDQHIGLHWHHFDQPLLPPVVHLQPQLSDPATPQQVLVYLPFEDLPQITALLQQLAPQQFVCYHPVLRESAQLGNIQLKPLCHQSFMQDLHHCNAVISNAGFELPSEALTLGKKLLVKPLAGQFEQQSNANTLVRLGLATRLHKLELAEIRPWLMASPAQPVVFPCVATALVDWVMAGRWQHQGSLADLSKTLWSQVAYPPYATIG
ncbi:glycosyltransferase [Rheinheimera riviphila]|uniref:Glycosyltransferase n=1 Tax=Rheinheimera riviphila TaxID=1834037 RepID=A0A437QT75_9GAMM|nr:MJ1255/VC2487 family glycosyltransferase [Rheinheimera riviphila]RVU37696.1 glycosyltransferase [Rheinheimera riviphila]